MFTSILYLGLLFGQVNVVDLVDKLDHYDYQVRESSRNLLIDSGYTPIPYLEQINSEEVSVEVWSAIGYITRQYYYQAYTKCSIWLLPKEERFINGVDLAEKYYYLARKKMLKAGVKNIDIEQWRGYDKIETYASTLFFIDKLKIGVDISELHRKMETFDTLKDAYIRTDLLEYLDRYKTPPPIEQFLEKLADPNRFFYPDEFDD
jgi:hypothetical protein